MIRKEVLHLIETERTRQFDLPGTEFDIRNSPNDWIAIASRYLTEEAKGSTRSPTADQFRESLVKAAAVIVAALENIETMQALGLLGGPQEEVPKSLGAVLKKL